MSRTAAAYRIAAIGDCMLAREVGRHFSSSPRDFSMKDIRAVLSAHDLVIANLECQVARGGQQDQVQNPHVSFRATPESLKILKDLGVNVVSLANNHMFDFGGEALAETLEHLDSWGIKYAGAGRNYEEANRPLLLERNGKKIAFLSHVFIYSASTRMATKNRPGVSDHRIDKILPRVRGLANSGYHVIVSVHWGMEYSFYPIPYQMAQARRMIENGASLVIGHGPHYPHGMEDHKDGHIVYSLGNFLFDEPHIFSNRSFMYSACLSPKGKVFKKEIFPFHIKNHIPVTVEGREKELLSGLVRRLGLLYGKKDRKFWQAHNSAYFSDIIGRVVKMKSVKFLFLPTPEFYAGIGLKNFTKKLKAKNMLSITEGLKSSLGRSVKKRFRTALPLGARKRLAIWINNQSWFKGRGHLAMGLIRDMSTEDPKGFHKFLWENHISGYAKWYDSTDLFDPARLEPSRAELFKDLEGVLRKLGLRGSDFSSVLEVGCSLGYLLRHIELNVFPGAGDIYGIDIDCEAIGKGKSYLKTAGSKVNLISGDMEDIQRLIGDRMFDLTFAAGVLSYLNEKDAQRVVNEMIKRTDRLIALVGLACKSKNNNRLDRSVLSDGHEKQWVHNFEAMVEKAGGKVVYSRWEGAKQYNYQTICFVFAVPAARENKKTDCSRLADICG